MNGRRRPAPAVAQPTWRDWIIAPDRTCLLGVTALAAAVFLVDLTISGYGNAYYAAAAQAGSQNLTALFFGSLDGARFITIDKPPLSIVPMALAIRLLGLGSLAVLLPQALAGIASVVFLFLAARRSFGLLAATVAGIVLALTPVAVLIFRFDNPDALLTLLLVSAAWALGRGLETGAIRWALAAAALIGLAFLTKYLEAYVVLPAFALTWLVSAPGPVRRRVAGLVASAATVGLASGWWVAIVALVPTATRPYIGGTASNSILGLILGYDGTGRLIGTGNGPGPTPGELFAGPTGPLRLFDSHFGGQIAWFLPGGLLGSVVGLARHSSGRRADPRLAGFVLWTTWLIVAGLLLSYVGGVIHAYYSVILAPPIAALVGGLVAELRGAWPSVQARAIAASGVALTIVTAALVLGTAPRFAPGLGLAVVIAGALGIVALLSRSAHLARLTLAGVVIVTIACLAGPTAYVAAAIDRPHADGDPAAGPPGDGLPGVPGGGLPTSALVSYLLDHRASASWIVAVRGGPDAAAIQLAADAPVMAIGGFGGTDPAPSLEMLRSDVAGGELRFVLAGPDDDTALMQWVRGTCEATPFAPNGTAPVGSGGSAPGALATLTLFDCAGR